MNVQRAQGVAPFAASGAGTPSLTCPGGAPPALRAAPSPPGPSPSRARLCAAAAAGSSARPVESSVPGRAPLVSAATPASPSRPRLAPAPPAAASPPPPELPAGPCAWSGRQSSGGVGAAGDLGSATSAPCGAPAAAAPLGAGSAPPRSADCDAGAVSRPGASLASRCPLSWTAAGAAATDAARSACSRGPAVSSGSRACTAAGAAVTSARGCCAATCASPSARAAAAAAAAARCAADAGRGDCASWPSARDAAPASPVGCSSTPTVSHALCGHTPSLHQKLSADADVPEQAGSGRSALSGSVRDQKVRDQRDHGSGRTRDNPRLCQSREGKQARWRTSEQLLAVSWILYGGGDSHTAVGLGRTREASSSSEPGALACASLPGRSFRRSVGAAACVAWRCCGDSGACTSLPRTCPPPPAARPWLNVRHVHR